MSRSRRVASYAYAISALLLLHHAPNSRLVADEASAPSRSELGLVVYYDFQSVVNNIIRDRSGSGAPLDLEITNPSAVQLETGLLTVKEETILRAVANRPGSDKLNRAIRRTGEITIEAWITPANTNQSGPARIVTLSDNSSNPKLHAWTRRQQIRRSISHDSIELERHSIAFHETANAS